MEFKKVVGKTQEETSELNKEFVDSIIDIYNSVSPDEIRRGNSQDRKVLAIGEDYLVTAEIREKGMDWTHLCKYLYIDVYFEDMMSPSNNKLATLSIESDGGWDNNSWQKLKAIMDGDISPESRIPQDKKSTSGKINLNKLPHGILIRTQGTDFFYSEDEFNGKSLDTKNNSLKLYKGNEVIKYFNLNYVVTIDFNYQPEVNDYAELKDYLRSDNNKGGTKHDN